MAASSKFCLSVFILIFGFLLLKGNLVNGKSEAVITEGVVTITSDNWRELLTGEWMVEFYAPWCPYCTQFTPVWAEFADWVNEFDVRVGQVDVTDQSILGGQFMVEQLPTIFHIKDGEVRMYSGERILKHLQNYIEHNTWLKDQPIPWYKSPTSLHMFVMGWLFKLAQEAQKIEKYLQDEYELPTWGIFGVIAAVTVAVGLLLGVICVIMFEVATRLMGRKAPPQKRRRPPQEEHPVETRPAETVPAEARPLEERSSQEDHPTNTSDTNKNKKDKKGARKRNVAKETAED